MLELETGIVAVDVGGVEYEKLSQIQCGFIIDEGQDETRELVEPEKNPRLNVLINLLEGVEGKAIVIYRHKAVFDLLYLYGGFGFSLHRGRNETGRDRQAEGSLGVPGAPGPGRSEPNTAIRSWEARPITTTAQR